MPTQDPIFGKTKKKSRLPLYVLLCVIFGAGYYLVDKYLMEEVNIPSENQAKALEHIKVIRTKLQKWHKNDYDANGKLDYPLYNLKKLRETEFVNGEKLELISKELSLSDLRSSEKNPCDGYFFTLTSPFADWPQEKMVSEIAIYAQPEIKGVTGVCSFYIPLKGQSYYSNYKLDSQKPARPSSKLIREKIWIPFWLD